MQSYTTRLFLPAFLSSWWLREEKINPKSQSHEKCRAGVDLIKTGTGLDIDIRRSLAIKRRQNWHKISLSWSRCGESNQGADWDVAQKEAGDEFPIQFQECLLLLERSGLWTQAKQAKYNKFINFLLRSITFNNSILMNIHFTAFVFSLFSHPFESSSQVFILASYCDCETVAWESWSRVLTWNEFGKRFEKALRLGIEPKICRSLRTARREGEKFCEWKELGPTNFISMRTLNERH